MWRKLRDQDDQRVEMAYVDIDIIICERKIIRGRLMTTTITIRKWQKELTQINGQHIKT